MMINVCEGKSIIASNGYSWNAWEAWLDENGDPIEPYSFRAGGRWEFFQHLAKCRKCRRANRITKKEVLKELKRIEEEWRSVTDP